MINEFKKIKLEEYNDLINSLPTRVSETPRKVLEDFISNLIDELNLEYFKLITNKFKIKLDDLSALPNKNMDLINLAFILGIEKIKKETNEKDII